MGICTIFFFPICIMDNLFDAITLTSITQFKLYIQQKWRADSLTKCDDITQKLVGTLKIMVKLERS